MRGRWEKLVCCEKKTWVCHGTFFADVSFPSQHSDQASLPLMFSLAFRLSLSFSSCALPPFHRAQNPLAWICARYCPYLLPKMFLFPPAPVAHPRQPVLTSSTTVPADRYCFGTWIDAHTFGTWDHANVWKPENLSARIFQDQIAEQVNTSPDTKDNRSFRSAGSSERRLHTSAQFNMTKKYNQS